MKLPFDGHSRCRLYLVRHGQAAARSGGGLYEDDIRLTPRGIEEARAMRDFLAASPIDVAYSSDMQRARETAAIVLSARSLEAAPSPSFTEIRGDLHAALAADIPLMQKLASFAYMMWNARDPKWRFLGGDSPAEYLAAAGQTLTRVVRDHAGRRVLIVSHSGFQRAALCWTLDCPPVGMAAFEQDSCCLNVLDIDVDAAGAIVRKHLRLANFTPWDASKENSLLTDGEQLAERLHSALKT